MKNNYISSLHFISKHLFTLLVLALLFIGVRSASGAIITVSGNTNWSALTVGVGDIVYVRNGATLTVNVSTAVCASLQIGGTTSDGAGTLAFSGTNPKITVSGLVQVGGWGKTNRDGFITFTNTATIDAGSVILGGTGGTNAQGTITMTAGGTLRTGSITVGSGSGTWTRGTGTVILNATNTLPSSIFTTFNNLTCSAGTTTMGRNLTIYGNLNINTNATFDCAQYQITGNATGTMTMAAGTGLAIGRNGQWDTNIFPTSFTKANINLDPTSTVTYNGGYRSFSNIPDYGNLTLNTTGYELDATGNTTINGNLSINSATTLRLAWSGLNTMTIGGQLIVSGILEFNNYLGQTVNVSGDLSGTGTISMKDGSSGTHTLNLNGQNNTIGTLITDGNNSVVNYGSAGSQQVFASPNYRSLTISGGGTKTFAGTTNINNRFTINDNVKANLGNLTHTANEYYLGAALQYKGSWGSTGSNATYTNDTNFDVAAMGILNTTTGACGPGYWVGASGALGTDWNTASNWCDNKVPTASTNVYIPNVTYKPIIGAAGGLCKNITIETGSSLTQSTTVASNLFVYGNWTKNGSYNSNLGTIIFAGASAQTIGGSSPTSFYYLTIQNTGGVTLSQPTTVTKTLLLISGNINSLTNLLSVTNTSYAGIMGGSSLSYINGPVKWNLVSNLTAATQAAYKFPVGNNIAYLPYTLVNPATGSNPTAQVQAFNASAGTNFSSPLTAISSTEYWKLTTSNFASTQATLGKGDAATVYPYNAIAESSTSNGPYTSLGGTPGYYEVKNSSTITTTNGDYYYTLGTNATPTINISPIVLGGFGYVVNFGPSAEQTFTVNGTSLQEGIVITAPTGYEISSTTANGFVQTITLARDGSNNVNNATLYIRLKADLPVGTYNGNSISITSTDAESKDIKCNGTVFATTPSILTSGGLNCDGNKIELFSDSSSPDINILYWTGPNNYYSQVEDPVISPVNSNKFGIYTVTGSLPTGANLIVNGDFEEGNTGFLSSYAYTPGNSSNQGIYNVTDNPQVMNGGFSPATPGDKQLVIDGATTANVTVWSQTVKVVPNSTYQFTYLLKNLWPDSPSIIQLYANNQGIGTPFTALSATGVDVKYYYNWYSGSNTSVTLDLRNQNTVATGNDFALDDIDFKTVTQVSSSVNVPNNHTSAVSISSPTLNVATGTATVAIGTNVTYTATSTNGGKAPTYVWTVTNGANVVSYPSTSSSTFNYAPVAGDVISCVMTASADNTCATTAISNNITMLFDGGARNYWIGTFGTDWDFPGNWTVGIPSPGDNVEFANATNNVSNGGAAKNHLYVANNKIIGNLINDKSGMNLIIPANTQLYVNNKITLTPVDPNAPYDQIHIKADPNLDPLTPIPNGSLIFHNSQDEKVYGSVEMYTKSYLNKFPANEDDEFFWQYFGIPVESIKAEPTFYGAYVRKANEAGDENDATYYWTELGNNDVLNAFDGYEICQKLDSKYLLFQGQLVNRDFSKTLIYSSGAKYPGQHLLANPYAAAINVNKINFGSDIEAYVSLYKTGSYGQWSGNNGVVDGTGPGQFTTIPKLPAGNNGLPQEVPSMSSMLVKVSSTRTDANSVISFNYKDVINKNTTIQKVKAVDALTNTDLISTRIDLTGQHYSDRMWIFTEPSCTRNFDNGWDGRKMLGSSLAPQIYAIEPDGDYQVNSVSDMHNTDLAFQAGDEVEYMLKFTHENIQRQYAGVYLVDLVENKTVDVSQNGSTYTFATAQSDTPAKRFKILTRPYEKGAPDKETQVKIFTAPGRVFVHNLTTFKGECTLYDIAGRAIKNASFAANAVTEVLNNLTPGAYVVNTITNGEKLSKRVIVQ